MLTIIKNASDLKTRLEAINTAAELLKSGKVAALPTETVYGLAGNALNPNALKMIFAVKKRPQDNPLIVHACDIEMVRSLGLRVPPIAERLFEAFSPGPLTIILEKEKDIIPPEISRGLNTVAVRIPANKITLDVIRKCNFPLAAPSANLSGSPSPTNAKRVYDDLNGRIPLIVDGGNCEIGLESSVIALEKGRLNNEDLIKLLRPGAVTIEDLSAFAPTALSMAVLGDDSCSNDATPSPGTKHRHYAPKAKVIAVMCDTEEDFYKVVGDCKHYIARPKAETLFEELRKFDDLGAKVVYARLPGKKQGMPSGIDLAIYNRIIRAADFNIIKG